MIPALGTVKRYEVKCYIPLIMLHDHPDTRMQIFSFKLFANLNTIIC